MRTPSQVKVTEMPSEFTFCLVFAALLPIQFMSANLDTVARAMAVVVSPWAWCWSGPIYTQVASKHKYPRNLCANVTTHND